jgi:hypothetical protein
MLGLRLREEFLGSNMPGTAIELRTDDKKGAVDRDAAYILSITYPTSDVTIALKAISEAQFGRPLVLKGERGRGKSHIMALMHHAIASPDAVEAWLKDWSERGKPDLAGIKLLRGYFPISEAVHNFEYTFLWDLLFDRHPRGDYYKGQFEGMRQPVPPRSLLERMFSDRKVCLILDEFQTWYNSLPEKKNGVPVQGNAFNFIQILSEIAKDSPEKLILVTSVLDGDNNAYKQMRRQNPVDIDFLGAGARSERQKLLLHRLFDNRDNITRPDIQGISDAYAHERIRLLFPNRLPQEKQRLQNEVYDCWPFSPELLTLLEEQILVSTIAQETRDLIKILAQVYKSRGDQSPVITPADFYVDGESDEVQTLITSIAANPNPDKLCRIAQNNLIGITTIAPHLKYVRELASAIWMHSLFHDHTSGVAPASLHLEITRNQRIADNDFQLELNGLIENSTHVFGGDSAHPLIKFSLEENPNSKARAFARNANLWDPNAVPTGAQQVYPAKDIEHLRKTLYAMFSPETQGAAAKIIILGPNWRTNPWEEAAEHDNPQNWDRPVLLVIPENIGPDSIGLLLGTWLKDHLQRRRNTIRFLLTSNSLYTDGDLIFLSRCSYLCSKEVWGQDRIYYALYRDYHSKLENMLKSRFDRYAILQKWDYQNPLNCVFETGHLSVQPRDVPKTVEDTLIQNHFDLDEFKKIVIQTARKSLFVKDVIDSLIEPPPPSPESIIPYLAETKICESIFRIAAKGEIAINVKGTWIVRRPEHTDDESALRYIQEAAYKHINEMKDYQLALPDVAGHSPTAATAGFPVSGGSTPSASPAGSDLFNGMNGAPAAGGSFVPSNGSPIPGQGAMPQIPPALPVTPPKPATIPKRETAAPNSSINLMGMFEQWKLSPEQPITKASIEFSGLTVQQIKSILQRIPSSFQAGMNIDYDAEVSTGTGGDV